MVRFQGPFIAPKNNKNADEAIKDAGDGQQQQ